MGLAHRLIVMCGVSMLLTFAGSAAAGVSGSIPSRGGVIFRPVVSGDWIVWSEIGNLGLYGHNIATGEDRTIVVPAFDVRTQLVHGSVNLWIFAPWHPQLAIDGTTVVWSDRREGDPTRDFQIYTYDLETQVETRIGPIGRTFGRGHYYPSIDGDRIAWQGGGSRVMTARTDGSDLRMVGGGGGTLPDVAGDLVIWTSGSAGASLYATDLVSGSTQLIHQFSPLQNPRGPVTDGRYVAWSMRDLTSGHNVVSIMAYDLLTGEMTTILDHTGSPEHRSNVAISDGIVVWEDWRNNTESVNRLDLDVWAYDLATGRSFPVAAGPGSQHEPWIDGDRVVWINESGGQRTIGYALLAPEPASLVWCLAVAASMGVRRRPSIFGKGVP